MSTPKTHVSKHEFVKHTTKYLALCEKEGGVIITHKDKPSLYLTTVKSNSLDDLRGILGEIKIHGDLNEHVLPGYDTWLS